MKAVQGNPTTSIRSTMVVPLVVKDVTIGCQTFSYHSNAIKFSPEQKDFAVKLGASLSLALENARLFSDQQAIASTLQEALLIVPETLPGIEIGHLYRSAAHAALVGGDFYDFFALQGDRIGIIIGDVSGKGLEAATLTSILKHTIKSYAFEGHSPGAIVSKTNILTMKETDSATFVTAFVGILDTQSGILTYCCAGHPPPIIKRQNGDIDLLDACCPSIGVLDFLDGQDKQQLTHPACKNRKQKQTHNSYKIIDGEFEKFLHRIHFLQIGCPVSSFMGIRSVKAMPALKTIKLLAEIIHTARSG